MDYHSCRILSGALLLVKTISKPAVLGANPIFSEMQRLAEPDAPSATEIASDAHVALSTGMLTKGPFLRRFEGAVAQHAQVDHSVAVSSCTSGILLAHRALKLEGEIILPSFTFLASALGCAWSNSQPVFVEVDDSTWNINPDAVEAAITSRTTAIIATHVFGNPADIERLERIAARHKLVLIFDAAHGFGALHQGKPLGRYGDCEIFSCSPTKLLQCGEGGVVCTDNSELAQSLTSLREYGNRGDYNLSEPGLNARMPELSAILGWHSLQRLDEIALKRNALADVLMAALNDLEGLTFQKVAAGDRSSLKDLVFRIDAGKFGLSRDELATALHADNMETRNYYDPPCHQQEYWLGRATCASTLQVTNSLARECLTVPLSSKMEVETIEKIALAIRQVHAHQKEVRTKLS